MRYNAALTLTALAALATTGECSVKAAAEAVKVIVQAGDAIINIVSDIVGRDELAPGDFAFGMAIPAMSGLEDRAAKLCFPVPNGVPVNVIENCCNSLKGKTMRVTGSRSSKKVRVIGVPYPCISAAPWIDNTGLVPYSCGDSCLEWANVSGADFDAIARAFGK